MKVLHQQDVAGTGALDELNAPTTFNSTNKTLIKQIAHLSDAYQEIQFAMCHCQMRQIIIIQKKAT